MHGYSLSMQRQRMQEFAKSQGWTIRNHYTDDGYSGKDTDRPGLQQMLAEARPGEVILVYRLDRLTRSVLDLHTLLNTFEERGILFRSVTEPFDTTTPSGKLMITIVAAIAEWERETIRGRTVEGLVGKVRNGEWPGGPVPFGYITEPSGEVKRGRKLLKLVPDPQRAHIVREIYERYLSGHGARGIAKWLTERGITTAKGGQWRPETVVRILTNPIYCGYIERGKRSKNTTVTRQKLRDHVNLVPEEMFEQVQRMFARRKQTAPRHATGDFPLAGVARCGVCGGSIAVANRAREGTRYYRCLNYVKGLGCGSRGKSLTSVPAPIIESAVIAEIQRILSPAHIDELYAQYEREYEELTDTTSAELERLRSDLRRAEAAIRRWDLAYEAEDIDREEWRERVAPHRDRIRIIREKLAEIEKMPTPPSREELTFAANHIAAAWHVMDAAERKAALQDFCAAYHVEILIYPDRTVELRPALR